MVTRKPYRKPQSVPIDLGRSFLLEGAAKINYKVPHFSFDVRASLVLCPKTLPLIPLTKFNSKI
jgi:hypothetical protein